MRNRPLSFFVVFCLAVMAQVGQHVYAQAPRTIEVGPHFGGTAYVGDLNVWKNLGEWDWKHFHQLDYDFGAVARFNYDPRWSFRLDYSYLNVNATDTTTAWRPQALLNFRSSVHDLSMIVEFNFLDYYTGHAQSSISPYIFAGVSAFLYTTRPFTGNVVLNEKPTDWYWKDSTYYDANGAEHTVSLFKGKKLANPAFSVSIPFGVGCKFSLSKHLAATLEWRMHYTFTDYLDDVSGLYGEKTVVDGYNADPSGLFSTYQQRGNSQTNDWFGMVNVSVTYKFEVSDPFGLKRLLLKLFPFYYKDRL